MIKQIHCFGTSFTEGAGFEWWKYEVVKEIYRPYIDEYPKEETTFPFSWPGQLKKLLPKDIKVSNHAKCGWGNQRVYRKIMEIVNQPNFKPKEHLFLIEFSEASRAEFWSVEKQKHFLINYNVKDSTFLDRGEVGNGGPVFDYQRTPSEDDKNYLKRISPIMSEYMKTTFSENDVIRRIEQNQVTFSSFMELFELNWLVPLPNTFCFNPLWYDKLYKDKLITDKNDICHQFSIQQNGYGFKSETSGVWNDGHGGLAWSEMIAMKTYNLMIEWGYLTNTEKLDVSSSKLNDRKIQIRNEINKSNSFEPDPRTKLLKGYWQTIFRKDTLI